MKVELVEVEAIRPLRHQVLRPGRPFSETEFMGDRDPNTFHLAAVETEEVIGIASMMKEARSHECVASYRLRGMATHPLFRKHGVGKALLEAALGEATQRGAKLVWCHAREAAVGFYTKMGFVVVGDRFELPGVGPHFTMEKDL